jgi:hypothetical protein
MANANDSLLDSQSDWGLDSFAAEDPAVSLADVLESEIVVAWEEAVSIVEELCDQLLRAQVELPVPSPAKVFITDKGAIRLQALKGAPPNPAEAARRLQELLAAGTPPPALRLFVSQAVSTAPHPSIAQFAEALAYYGTPDRRERIQAVYNRCALRPVATRVPAAPAARPLALVAPAAERFPAERTPQALPPQKFVPPTRRPQNARAPWMLAGASFLLTLAAGSLVWWIRAPETASGETISESAAAQRASATLGAPDDPGAAFAVSTWPSSPWIPTPLSPRSETMPVATPDFRGRTAVTPMTPATSAPPRTRQNASVNRTARPPTRVLATRPANRPEPSAPAPVAPAPVVRESIRQGPLPASTPVASAPVASAPVAAAPVQSTLGRPMPPRADEPAAPDLAAAAPPAADRVAAEPDARVYSSADSQVQPPRLRQAQLLPPMRVAGPAATLNQLELIVSASGSVERARFLQGPQRMADMMILSSAKLWSFMPASKDGVPVRYRTVLAWASGP